MRTVEPSKDEVTETETDVQLELQVRKRARKVIDQVWPASFAVFPPFELVEAVALEIVVSNEKGIDEKATEKEIKNLTKAHHWALEAYDDGSIPATLRAYQILFSCTDNDRWNELLDAISEL